MGNPLTVIVAWAAAGGVYPPGPDYAGYSIRVAPAYAYFSPEEANAPGAPAFNFMFWQRDTWLQQLQTWTGTSDGQNWGPLTASSSTVSGNIHYSSAIGAWVAESATESSGSYQVSYSTDFSTWQTLGAGLSGGAGPASSFVTTPSGTLIAFLDFTSISTQAYVPSSNTWAAAVAGPAAFTAGLSTNTQRYFAGVLVWSQCYSGATAKIAYSTNLGTTWTAVASGIPANFGENASSLPLLAAVGSPLLLLFSQVANATQYVSSPDGENYTTQAMPALLTGEAVAGADFDAANGIYYLAVTTATTSRLLSSTTGLAGSWTQVTTFAHPLATAPALHGFGALACNGGELAMIMEVGPAWRIMLSSSAAPTAWGFARSSIGYATACLRAEGNGFIYESSGAAYFAVTHQAGAPQPLLI
jgi:hypothetical protein